MKDKRILYLSKDDKRRVREARKFESRYSKDDIFVCYLLLGNIIVLILTLLVACIMLPIMNLIEKDLTYKFPISYILESSFICILVSVFIYKVRWFCRLSDEDKIGVCSMSRLKKIIAAIMCVMLLCFEGCSFYYNVYSYDAKYLRRQIERINDNFKNDMSEGIATMNVDIINLESVPAKQVTLQTFGAFNTVFSVAALKGAEYEPILLEEYFGNNRLLKEYVNNSNEFLRYLIEIRSSMNEDNKANLMTSLSDTFQKHQEVLLRNIEDSQKAVVLHKIANILSDLIIMYLLFIALKLAGYKHAYKRVHSKGVV